MRKIILHIISSLLLVFIFCNCEKDIEIFTESNYQPIIYCIYCPDDSLIKVRIGRSFQENQSAYVTAKVPDTTFLSALEVSLDFMNRRETQLLARQKIPLVQLPDRNDGIFYRSPNYCFSARTIFPYNRLDGHSGKLILTVFDSISQRFSSAQTTLLSAPMLLGPINPLGTYNASLYSVEPLSVWYMSIDAAYEVDITLYYSEAGDNGKQQTDSISWIMPIDYNNTSILPSYKSYRARFPIYGDDFLRNVADKMRSKGTNNKKFKSFAIRLYVYDPVLREYQNAIEAGLDLHPSYFSNVTNGLGVFACSRWSETTDLKLDYRSLDSLSNGQYTKHLNFRLW